MILGHSSNGSADEQERRSSAKLNLEGDKERKIALSISKLKAARYLDFGLEELVPSLWVESERDYDISAATWITQSVMCSTQYSRKAQPSAKTDKTSLHTAVNHVIRNWYLGIVVGVLAVGIESSNNAQPRSPDWDTAELFLQNKIIDLSLSQVPLDIKRTELTQRKLLRLNELHKFSDGTLIKES
ncbi:hypothetical protein Tco_0732507 [Tanacetum coccineum]